MAVPGRKVSDGHLTVFCQPCDRDGERLAAHGYCKDCCEHLCESCFKHHMRHTLSRDHILVDKTNMPQTLQPSSTFHYQQHDDFTKPCHKHKREVINFYCQDHNELLCSVCVTHGHHQHSSCKVSYIPDISENVIDGKEYLEMLKTMDSMSEQFRKIQDRMYRLTVKANKTLANVLEDIKLFRKEINQKLDELEKQAAVEVNVFQDENLKILKEVETACNDRTRDLWTSCNSMKRLNSSKQAEKLFMEVKSAEKMIEDCEKRLVELAKFKVNGYSFTPNETISKLLTSEKSLGILVQKTMHDESTTNASMIFEKELSYHEDICVKTAKDTKRCWITGMIVLTPNTLVITDKYNMTVKLINTCSRYVTDRLQLDCGPYDITSVTSTELGATLPSSHKIQFIAISSNKLKQQHTIKVDGNCWGISCYQDKLVVSFCDPAKLQILDMDGIVLETFEDQNFRNPLYVEAISSSIFISDTNKKRVTRINWYGQVIGSYGDMNEPRGILLSDDGTVFVCDREKQVVKEILGDCSAGKVIMKDISSLQAVCWCSTTMKLYYSSEDGVDRDKNNFIFTSINCNRQ
ncbi:uncharacterized protein LOC132717477 [Ruditapes philippinarum]|uniref:uncharacterized protein LOC132717477 n=1 Tax=Ruditapes philippinarum TaxID=129788 RepID=UPI00295B04E9|nr:uncharacterized protein LOC132717477 [Ruditapes philippinarum]